MQFQSIRIVAKRIRHMIGIIWNRCASEYLGSAIRGKARRPFRAIIGCIMKALAIAMEPEDSVPDSNRSPKEIIVGGQGNPDPRHCKIRGEGCGVSWMSHY